MRRLRKWFKKYFIPHRENHHRPHLLRHKSMLVVLVAVLALELLLLLQVFVVFDKTGFLASVLPGVLTSLTNDERTANESEPLKENSLLVKAAKLKAEDMATYGYFAHTSPDGKTPWYWLEKVGYSYTKAGENLAVNFFESKDVARAWMNSPSHRANILKNEYSEIGIGIAEGKYEGKNTIFVAQFFGTPIAESANLPIEDEPKAIQLKTQKAPTVASTTQAPDAAPTSIQVLGEEEVAVDAVEEITPVKERSRVISFFAKVLSSPSDYVRYIFGSVIFVIVLTLALLLFVKSDVRHPLLAVRGVLVVSVILLLLSLNTKLLDKEGEIPSENMSASAIDF